MDYLKLGSISGFFGVKGWVKVYSLTRPRENIVKYKQFYIGDQKEPFAFQQIKVNGKNIVGSIVNVTTRELAASFLGQDLYIKQDELPRENGQYYWVDLVGLLVKTKENESLGAVSYLIETGANDVLVIENSDQDDILIPFVLDHFVLSIDLDKKEMIVDWEIDDNEV